MAHVGSLVASSRTSYELFIGGNDQVKKFFLDFRYVGDNKMDKIKERLDS